MLLTDLVDPFRQISEMIGNAKQRTYAATDVPFASDQLLH